MPNTQKTEEWEKYAILFHETYEKLAPDFGYATRTDTKKFDKESPNGKLMIAVCKEVISQAQSDTRKEIREFAMKNNTDESIASMLYGMKLRLNPLVPEDEIWLGTEKSSVTIKLPTKSSKK